MITITPNLDQVNRAIKLYEFGILDNSLTQGDGNAAGAIAEICFLDYFSSIGKDIFHAQHHDYDFIMNKKKIEIKATRVNNPPRLVHQFKLPCDHYDQQCDFYCCIYVMNDFSKVFINGYISKIDFFNNAILHLEGEMEHNFTFRCDTKTVTLAELKPLNHE
jgi:hypothetical protein